MKKKPSPEPKPLTVRPPEEAFEFTVFTVTEEAPDAAAQRKDTQMISWGCYRKVPTSRD